MNVHTCSSEPAHNRYDVVIVGGAMMGSATAWFLTDLGFDGRVLVVERDPNYEKCSTAHTNSCIRQQFSSDLNIRISQFTARFIRNLRAHLGDERVPDLKIQNYGYMYLANSEPAAERLRAAYEVQRVAGAGTRLMSAEEIKAEYPFYHVDDVILGSHNVVDEGFWDGPTVFSWFRRLARTRGIEYIANEVVGMERLRDNRVDAVILASGRRIACGNVVNASGPRAARTAAMAGLSIPVEPRKRMTYVFAAQNPTSRDLPLTVDPSGVHVRQDGIGTYLAGCAPFEDPAVDHDDFHEDPAVWEEKAWPAIAARIPQFDALRLINSWAGHYAFNTFDHNAIIGPHDEVANFWFQNGFSGHGLQQSPAMGRGMAELLTFGEFRSLDLSPFGYDRIAVGRPFVETAVI